MSEIITDNQLDVINSSVLSILMQEVTQSSNKLDNWRNRRNQSGVLNIKHVQYLFSIADLPLLNTTERSLKLGWTNHMENKIKAELLAMGLIYELEICTGGRGGRVKIAELSEKGKKLLLTKGKKAKRSGRGSLKHQFWQKRIANDLNVRGWSAAIEKKVGETFIDVYAAKQQIRVAIEIALTDEEHQAISIRKNLELELNRIFVLCEDKVIENKIIDDCSKSMKDNELEKLNFILLKEFRSFLDSNSGI